MSTHPQANRFFLASCIALIVTAMSFALRADLVGIWIEQFGMTNEQGGWVTGAAFIGFPLAMVIGGPLCDVLGMGRLMVLAFVGHVVGTVLTIYAGGFWSLFLATVLVGVGNGFVEAACNPLVATLYPNDKTTKLNQFHVWFPGGIVIGGLIAYLMEQAGMGWQLKVASMLLPSVIYGVMFYGMKFPATERVASGVSSAEMFKAVLRPLFIFMAACMVLTAATELGTNQWLPVLLANVGVPGILILVWINGLMALGRLFAGPVVHRLAPAGVLLLSAVFSTIGLLWLSAATGYTSLAAAAVFAVGICYFWPTMLGFVAEYVPRSGALGLAVMGGIGAVATSIAQPFLGGVFDEQITLNMPADKTLEGLQSAVAGSADATLWAEVQAAAGPGALRTMAILPVVLIIAFGCLYAWQRGKATEKLAR